MSRPKDRRGWSGEIRAHPGVISRSPDYVVWCGDVSNDGLLDASMTAAPTDLESERHDRPIGGVFVDLARELRECVRDKAGGGRFLCF